MWASMDPEKQQWNCTFLNELVNYANRKSEIKQQTHTSAFVIKALHYHARCCYNAGLLKGLFYIFCFDGIKRFCKIWETTGFPKFKLDSAHFTWVNSVIKFSKFDVLIFIFHATELLEVMLLTLGKLPENLQTSKAVSYSGRLEFLFFRYGNFLRNSYFSQQQLKGNNSNLPVTLVAFFSLVLHGSPFILKANFTKNFFLNFFISLCFSSAFCLQIEKKKKKKSMTEMLK